MPICPRQSEISYEENPIPAEHLNRIFCKSSEDMTELPDNSVHLMVTSPPYNVGKEYDQDATLEEYLEFLGRVWREVYRVLVPGGRACVNVANLGRKPYIPLHAFIVPGHAGPGFPDAGRNHLEQGRQRLSLHRLGLLALAGQPDPSGCARIHLDLLQSRLLPQKPA